MLIDSNRCFDHQHSNQSARSYHWGSGWATSNSYSDNLVFHSLQNIQSNVIFIDRLLSNQNYSITLKLSDINNLRLLPSHVFQTLSSSDATSNEDNEGKESTDVIFSICLALTLSATELLSIEQIESFLFPQTHVYIVSLPSHLHRSTLVGHITLSYSINGKHRWERLASPHAIVFFPFEGERVDYHQIVKPLDQNAITRLGRITKKTVLFSVELPFGNGSPRDYSSSLQLFFPNDPRQSLLDHPVTAKSLPGIAVDFRPIITKDNSGRSTRVHIHHLCSSYIEVKAIVYKSLSNKVHDLSPRKALCSICHSWCPGQEIVARYQCDINKNETSLLDIANGQCSMLFDKLQPEQNYTLSIRATCPLAVSATSSYVFYDRARLFPFQTSIGSPDYVPFNLSFNQQNKTLSWTVKNSSDSFVSPAYVGPGYYFELLSK